MDTWTVTLIIVLVSFADIYCFPTHFALQYLTSDMGVPWVSPTQQLLHAFAVCTRVMLSLRVIPSSVTAARFTS